MEGVRWNPPLWVSTGTPDSERHVPCPTDVVSTVLNSIGKSHDDLNNRGPVIPAGLKKTST